MGEKSGGGGRFISEKIEVWTSPDEPLPLGFTWRGREYSITEIVRKRQNHGFSNAAPVRNVYIVLVYAFPFATHKEFLAGFDTFPIAHIMQFNL